MQSLPMGCYPPVSQSRHLLIVLKWLLELRPITAWTGILLCADLTALADALTGGRLWFGPVYLLVICLAAWCRGWRAGVGTGLGCMVLTFALNGSALYHAGAAWTWNFVSRFGAISAIAAVVAGARHAYVREWWLARTDPLTGAFNRQAFFEVSDDLAKVHSWRLLIYADLR